MSYENINRQQVQNILNSQESIIVYAHNGKIMIANDALLRFFGFKDLTEFLEHYDCVCDRFESDDKRYLTKQMGELSWKEYILKTPEIEHKVKIKDKDGHEYIFRVDIKDISEEDSVITFTDITDLEDFSYKVQNILNSQESIIVYAQNGKTAMVNDAFFKFFEFKTLKEFLKKHDCVCDKFEEGDRRYITKQMGDMSWKEYILNNPYKVHKVRIKDKNGEDAIFRVDIKDVSSEDSVVTFTNITELENLNENLTKQVEEKTKEIEKQNMELEERVKEEVEKNRQQEQQLIQQSRLAQMGEMISMIAHQWRQPLTAISSTANTLSLDVMMENYDKDFFASQIENIAEYSQHLSQTIDDFRGFFKDKKKKESVSLEEIVKSTLDIARVSIENRDIAIETVFECNEKFESYSSELKQVVLNLIKNAQDILLEKQIVEPTITIRTFKDGRSLVLEVKDNAGGVPKSIKDKIFEPYFSTKLEKDGTGLGLYMSKTIIEEHCGGSLSVSNDEDGAVFRIEFLHPL